MAVKGWDENLLAHPMAKFMHAEEQLFVAKEYEKCEAFYAPEFVYTKGTGEAFSGSGCAGFKEVIKHYSIFAEYSHEPVYGVITETDDGYCLLGQAKLFVNLPVPGDKKFEDVHGRKWECEAQGAYRVYVKRDAGGPQGFLFTSLQVFSDPTPILSEAIKRGIISVEALTA